MLAYKAYDAQMTRLPVRQRRRNNLEAPVYGLHRTHGSFDREAGCEAMLVPGRSHARAPALLRSCWHSAPARWRSTSSFHRERHQDRRDRVGIEQRAAEEASLESKWRAYQGRERSLSIWIIRSRDCAMVSRDLMQ